MGGEACGVEVGCVVNGSDGDRGAAGYLQGTAGALAAGVAVIKGPADLGAGRWCIGAVGVGDLLQDVVDVGGGRCLAVGISKGDSQLARDGGGVEDGDGRTALLQHRLVQGGGSLQRDAVAIGE